MEYPVKRNLDGVYYRAERNGRWTSLCFTDLTQEEQEKFIDSLDESGKKRMCFILANALRSIGDGLNLYLGDDDSDE